jgi:transposase-like protein
MSSGKVFNQAEKIKLQQVITEGISILNEVETLNGGLTDTIKAVAEELDIKPSTLKKALKIAYKSTLTQTNEDHENVVTILETIGRTQ